MDSSTARGLLMLRPIPTTPPTDSDTPDSDTSTARGLLMLSLRLRLILTTDTVLDTDMVSDTDTALDTPDISDTPDTADTTTASRLPISTSFSQPTAGVQTKMDYYQFEVPFTSAT